MFLIIILSGIMGLMATDLFVPSLPSIATFYHQTQGHTELTISLFLIAFCIAQLFYGPISDSTGRRTPLVIGTLFFMLGSALSLWATTFSMLCLGRLIQGIGAAAGTSLMRVILRDVYQGVTLAEKSSQAAMFISLTPAVAPFIGGLLQSVFGYRATFLFMLLFSLLLVGLLLCYFKETLLTPKKNFSLQNTLQNYADLLHNSFFIKNVFASGIGYAIVIIFANIIPFIVQNTLHFTPLESGASILFAALGICSGATISKKYVAKIGSQNLILYGFALLTLSGFLLLTTFIVFGTHLYFLVPLIFIATLTCGFIFPNTMALAFSKIKCHIGVAGAIYGSLQIIVAMLTNLLLNFLSNQNQVLLGLLYFLLGSVGLILSYKPTYHTKLHQCTRPTL